MRWSAAAPLLGVLALIALFGVGLTLKPGEVPSPLIGKPVPAFDTETLDGRGRLDSAVFSGAPTVLNVWGSWCPGCLTEHSLLIDLAQRPGVRLIGLNWKDERRAARRWLERHGNPYAAVAFDPSGDVGIDFGVYGAPETFVVDATGVIRYKHIGPLTPKVINAEVLPLLAELGGAS